MFFRQGKKTTPAALFGAVVTGVTGAVIGSIIGGPPWAIGVAAIGVVIGVIVSRLGGGLFPRYITAGALSCGLLAVYLRGADVVLLGAAVGGAMGGFLAVNVRMFSSRADH